MKKLIFVCFILMSLFACKKETGNLYEGKITGFDYRKCFSPCCGGFFIQIGDSTYRSLDIPENSQMDLSTEHFPVSVVLEWQKVQNSCGGDLITISYIRKK
jgi:hypothetical protein